MTTRCIFDIMANMNISDDRLLRVVAANVRKYRGDRSYGEIARAAGTYPSSIKRIEDGLHMPGAGLLARLAVALDVKVTDLLPDRRRGKKSETAID